MKISGLAAIALACTMSFARAAEPAVSLDAIRAALVGTWQGTDDTKFSREFDQGGAAVERYEGDSSATTAGTWQVFAGSVPPAELRNQKFLPAATYLEIRENGDQLVFALVGLSRSELRMIYLERGNMLAFTRLR
jgi:hypothetical protein